MKNKYEKRTIKLLCLLLVVIAFVGMAQRYVFTYFDHNRMRVQGFYKESKNSLDVVVLGASDVFYGFSSAYAYEQYGYTSYPYAIDSSPVSLYKSQVNEILREQNPQYIIVEINGVLYDDANKLTEEAALRRYIDSIPSSWNKYKTIFEMVPKEEIADYLFPISKYHSKWTNGGQLLFDAKDILSLDLRGTSLLKGNYTYTKKEDLTGFIDVDGNTGEMNLEPKSKDYLLEFLDYLKINEIDNVIFVRFPHVISDEYTYERYLRCNQAEKIIEAHGFSFINMERENKDLGLDVYDDFRDCDHLNIYGQRKLTDYLSNIMINEYGLKSNGVSDGDRMKWEESVEYYNAFYRYAEDKMNIGEDVWMSESDHLLAELSKDVESK